LRLPLRRVTGAGRGKLGRERTLFSCKGQRCERQKHGRVAPASSNLHSDRSSHDAVAERSVGRIRSSSRRLGLSGGADARCGGSVADFRLVVLAGRATPGLGSAGFAGATTMLAWLTAASSDAEFFAGSSWFTAFGVGASARPGLVAWGSRGA